MKYSERKPLQYILPFRKGCSGNMQQIYRRKLMSKCDFYKKKQGPSQLAHFRPILHFYTLRKHQKSRGFQGYRSTNFVLKLVNIDQVSDFKINLTNAPIFPVDVSKKTVLRLFPSSVYNDQFLVFDKVFLFSICI